MSSQKKIGIFGGSFDPVHSGHIKVLLQIQKLHDFDEIVFIPTYSVNSSKKIVATPEQRIRMLEISLKNYNFKIDLREIKREGISYTVDTLMSFREEYPNSNLVLILGSDTFLNLPKWKNHDQILKLCNIIVLKRNGHTFDDLISKSPKFLSIKLTKDATIFDSGIYGNILYDDSTEIEVSSSRIREILKNGQSIDGLIDKGLQQWLSLNKIY